MGDSAHTTHHINPGKKSALPLFLEDENVFLNSASMVLWGVVFPGESWRPMFAISSHLRDRGGVLMLLKTTLHLEAKAQ
jgi:hypothetical protein